MAIREIFSLEEIEDAASKVKESTLNALGSEKGLMSPERVSMHIIQMAGNIVRYLKEAYSHKEMDMGPELETKQGRCTGNARGMCPLEGKSAEEGV